MHFVKSSLIAFVLLGSSQVFFGDNTATAQENDITFSKDEVSLIKAFGPWSHSVPEDPGNELSGQLWAERLGERLFEDPILSGNNSISCATCHQAELGFSDGLATAQGVQLHQRNTQGLLNVAHQRWFGWDGGADSLWAASLRPIFSSIEMNSEMSALAERLREQDYVVTALQSNLDSMIVDNTVDTELVVLAAKALGAYQRTLVSSATEFDYFRIALINGDKTAQSRYSRAAKRGLKIFMGSANCHVCHFGPQFSNKEFHDTGRPFFVGKGQVDAGRYSGIKRVKNDRFNLLGEYNGTLDSGQIRKTNTVQLTQQNFGQWRTPTLRALKYTGPYMHDGSLETLREVVDHYADIDMTRLHTEGESLLNPLPLSDRDRNDLVEFLLSLSN